VTLDPALNVPCPTCRVKAGEPCRSRRAISLHQGRREALADLSVQARQLLAAGRKPAPQESGVKLTMAEIEAGRSPSGGWSAATLASWGVPWPPPKGWLRRLLKDDAADGPPVPVLIGETGSESAIPETAEYWPPWEHPPVPGCLAESSITVTGLVWCPVHREYEELRDGMPGVRMAGKS
jgi:hypothetical protein